MLYVKQQWTGIFFHAYREVNRDQNWPKNIPLSRIEVSNLYKKRRNTRLLINEILFLDGDDWHDRFGKYKLTLRKIHQKVWKGDISPLLQMNHTNLRFLHWLVTLDSSSLSLNKESNTGGIQRSTLKRLPFFGFPQTKQQLNPDWIYRRNFCWCWGDSVWPQLVMCISLWFPARKTLS